MLSAPAWIVIIVVLVLSTFALVATIMMLLTHLRELAASVATIRDDLKPRLEAIQVQAEVTRAELAAVQEGRDRLADERDERRRPSLDPGASKSFPSTRG